MAFEPSRRVEYKEMKMLEGPVLMPTSGKVKSLVILSHGYGSNGDDLINLGKTWQPLLPETVFVAPTAPSQLSDPAPLPRR